MRVAIFEFGGFGTGGTLGCRAWGLRGFFAMVIIEWVQGGDGDEDKGEVVDGLASQGEGWGLGGASDCLHSS